MLNKKVLLGLTLPLLIAGCNQTEPVAEGQPPVVVDASKAKGVVVGNYKPNSDGLRILNANHPAAIPGQYIVVLRDGALPQNLSAQSQKSPALAQQAIVSALGLQPQGLSIQQMYSQAVTGFAGQISAQNLELLRHNPNVKYIEQDAKVKLSATQSSPRNWGLDRIDQRNLPLSRSYSYQATGRGVTAYIVDSGINIDHSEFTGRGYWGTNTVNDGKNYDCNTHGTHVAGIVGGTQMGVAKNVNLVAVKVLDCSGGGSISSIISGLDWVLRDTNAPGRKVINMSINAYDRATFQVYHDTINRLASNNIPLVNSAGNQNDDACYHGPADVPAAIVVAASDAYDRRASFSNYGSCVDIFAPGVDILSADANTTSGFVSMDGTSMAAPHVAGVIARLLESQPNLSTSQVVQTLANTAGTGLISNPSGSVNRLLYINDTTTTTTNPQPQPVPTGNTFNGSLSAGQSGTIYSNGQQASGTLKVGLTAGSGTDFDLYLQRWNGSSWQDVASSEGPSSTENITYSATSGSYRVIVYAYSGSGSFTVTTNF